MPQWIVDLVGESLASIVWVAIVATAVCLLAVLMIVLAKKAFGGRIGNGFKGNAPRLAVMDVARIDEKRRLILVRRDEVEHLVLVGGQNDVLIEGSILRVFTATDARLDEPHDDFPAFDEDMSPEPASSRAVAPIPVPFPEAKPLAPSVEPRQPETVASRPPAESKSRPAPIMAPSPVPPAPTVPPASMAPGTEQAKTPAYSAAPIPEIDADRSTPATAQSLPPRSIATPTLNLRQSRSTTEVRNVSSESPASESAAARPASPASSRREPSLAVPDVQREPMASEAEQPRADLRAQMNRAQSPALEPVQDATAPAIAVDAADRRDSPRQPLSVRSFATAIQNRKAPPERPQPTPKAAEAATPQNNANATRIGPDERDRQPSGPSAAGVRSTSSSQTEAALKQPSVPEDAGSSLEELLSAEIDSDFGNDAFFADEPDEVDSGADTPRAAPQVGASRSRPATPTAVEAPRVAPPAPPASSAGNGTPLRSDPQPETPPRTTAAPVPLTLEEEMERLLGDFNFGDESDRKAN